MASQGIGLSPRVLDWSVFVALTVFSLLVDSYVPAHRQWLGHSPKTNPQLTYPYLEETITKPAMAMLSIALPFVIIACRGWWARAEAKEERSSPATATSASSSASSSIPKRPSTSSSGSSELHTALLAFLTNIILTYLATVFVGEFVGRPRPNFLAYTEYDTTTGTYGADDKTVNAGYRAFVSGHGSVTFAGLGFLAYYMWHQLQPRNRSTGASGGSKNKSAGSLLRSSPVALLVVCSLPLWLALYVSLTRIRDHHHSEFDILGGCTLGGAIGYTTFRALYLAPMQQATQA